MLRIAFMTNNKQNQPKDHHYVPVCYLKNFCDESGKLASLNLANLKKGYSTPIKHFYPKQICYVKNYYEITQELRHEFSSLVDYDDLFVESEVLNGIESHYPRLFDQIIRNRFLLPDDANMMADFMIQLKLRNPYWRDYIVAKNIDKWIDELIDVVANGIKNS